MGYAHLEAEPARRKIFAPGGDKSYAPDTDKSYTPGGLKRRLTHKS